jgi:hypothetical protein
MVGDQVYTRGGAGCSPRPLGSRRRGGLRESVRRWLAVAFPYPHRCSLDARGSGGQSRARAGAVTTGPLLQLLLAGADLRVSCCFYQRCGLQPAAAGTGAAHRADLRGRARASPLGCW